jgi:hypothetical protein
MSEIGYSSAEIADLRQRVDGMIDGETEGTLWQACRRNRVTDNWRKP